MGRAFQRGVEGWVPALLQDGVNAPWAAPGSWPCILTLRIRAHGVFPGMAAAWELWECTLSSGPVALSGSLSRPICCSSTDSTLAVLVTAWLSARGCSPLGVRGGSLEARTGLGTTRRGWLLVGALPASALPPCQMAGHGTGTAAQNHWTLHAVPPGHQASAGTAVGRPSHSHAGRSWQHGCPHCTDEGSGDGRRLAQALAAVGHVAVGCACHPSSQAHGGLSETMRRPGLTPPPRPLS